MSQLGWIDFSPDERDKVNNVLAMLSEPGTLDELGIGQIRDAYADALFPGISTIQTRAKYFITIPRIIRDYQKLPPAKRKQGLGQYMKDRENEIAQVLADYEDNETGIIGRTRTKSGGVERRPSIIYWNGLRTFGILNTNKSFADYCRRIDTTLSHTYMDSTKTDEGCDDKQSRPTSLVRLPDKPIDWMEPDTLSLKLSKVEAEFLKGKLIETPQIQHSLLSQLFQHDLIDTVIGLQSFDDLAKRVLNDKSMSVECKKNTQLANEFSLAIEGAHIRYNILAARNNSANNAVAAYEAEYDVWKKQADDLKLFSSDSANRWLSIFGDGTKRSLNSRTREFVCDYCRLQHADSPLTELDEIIEKQALENKRERSLLKKKINGEDWVWIGIRRLDYRWGSAKVILQDIRDGLNA